MRHVTNVQNKICSMALNMDPLDKLIMVNCGVARQKLPLSHLSASSSPKHFVERGPRAAQNPTSQIKTLRSAAAPCSTPASPSPSPYRSSRERLRLAAPSSPVSSAPGTSLSPLPPHLRFVRPPPVRAPGRRLRREIPRASAWYIGSRSPLHQMVLIRSAAAGGRSLG